MSGWRDSLDLIMVIVFLIMSLHMVITYKRVNRHTADCYKRSATWLEKHPWIALVLGFLICVVSSLVAASAALEITGKFFILGWRDMLINLIAGIVSIFIFLYMVIMIVQYKQFARYLADSCRYCAIWYEKQPWFSLALGLLACVMCIILVANAAFNMIMGNSFMLRWGYTLFNLFSGIFFLIISLNMFIGYRQVTRSTADADRLCPAWLERRPWVLLVVGLVFSVICIICMISAYFEVIRNVTT